MCFATYTIRFYETITFWIAWLRTGIVWNQIWTICILIMILGFIVELSTVRCYRLNCLLSTWMPLFILRGTPVFCYFYDSCLWDRYFWIVWLRTGFIWNQIWTVWFLYVSEEVSYRLTLPPQLSHVHNIFRVSLPRESLLSFLACDTLLVWFEITCYVLGKPYYIDKIESWETKSLCFA